MFLRYIAIFILLAHTNGQKSELLGNIFSQTSLSNKTLDSIRCNDIQGTLQDCYDCYTCDELTVEIHRSRGDIIRPIKLIDDNCETTEICCISQRSLIFRYKTNCGIANPGGYPRSLRSSARSVLQGEYPWRAWIYSVQNPSTPKCGATVFGDDSRTLLTSASCVESENAGSIFVTFSPDSRGPRVKVEQVIVHAAYNAGSQENSVALVSLAELPRALRWVRSACLSLEPPQFATPCIAVSKDMNFINAVIVQSSSCDDSLAPSLMCALAPPNDYVPEHGSGLFCLDESGTEPTYFLHGIALHNNDKTTGVYTDVSRFSDWIQTHIPKKSRY